MSTYQDIRDAANAVGDAKDAENTAALALNDKILEAQALISTELSAFLAASEAYETAFETAKTTVDFQTAADALATAQSSTAAAIGDLNAVILEYDQQ